MVTVLVLIRVAYSIYKPKPLKRASWNNYTSGLSI
jgi:hypothetical protein